MIQNKQINIWRGPDTPPTLYHIWFKDESQLLRYDDEVKEWVVFLDSNNIAALLQELVNSLDNIKINGYPITQNVVLNANDLLLGEDGYYIKKGSTLQQATLKLDSLLTTKIYDQ